jgi:hypothetical protein
MEQDAGGLREMNPVGCRADAAGGFAAADPLVAAAVGGSAAADPLVATGRPGSGVA